MLLKQLFLGFALCVSSVSLHADFGVVGEWYQGQNLPYLGQTLAARTDRDLRFLYVLGRIESGGFLGLSVFELPEDGAPAFVQLLAEDAGYSQLANAVDLLISPDDRFVYVPTANFGTYERGLGVYARNEADGRLRFVAFQEHVGVALIGFDDTGETAFGRDNQGRLVVLRRDPDDGRLHAAHTYTHEQVGSIEAVTHWHWVASRRLLLGYSPAETAVTLFQFDGRGDLAGTRSLGVDPNYVDPNHPLTFCHFSEDGRLLLLAGNRRRTVVQLYLDLDQATIADFRQTDLGPFDDVGYGELDHYTFSLFDEVRGRLILFMGRGFWPDIVDIGFPFAANEVREALGLNGLNYALASFPLADGRFVAFPAYGGGINIYAVSPDDGRYQVVHEYDQSWVVAGPEGPTDVVAAANCRDLYLADGDNGLFHLNMGVRERKPVVVNLYQEPRSDDQGFASDRFFGDLKLSDDGRFLYVLNSVSVRVYGRDLADGALLPLDRLELPFDQERARFDLIHFSLTDDQRQLLVFDSLGRIVAYNRNPDSGLLTHAQTIIGGAEGAVGLRIWDSYAVTADQHLFVFLENAQMLIFQYVGGEGWVQRGLIDSWPDAVRPEYVLSVDFDERRKQLWLRTLEGIRLFDWDAAGLNLDYAGALAFGDTPYEEISPVGPLVFHEDRAYFGSTNDNTLMVFEYGQNGWRRIARIEDNSQDLNHIGGMSALAIDPSGTRLMVTARDDKALTMVDTARARSTRAGRKPVQVDRPTGQPRRR